MNSTTYGRAGEKEAAGYLIKNKYRIIANNYIVNGGELDIVAFKHGALIFIEVKTRSSSRFGNPGQAVNIEKISNIKYSSDIFLREQSIYGKIPVYSRLFKKQIHKKVKNIRFDIIEIYMSRNLKDVQINHIENAF